MNSFRKGRHGLALAALLATVAAPGLPALGQDNSAEARLRRLESEVRALQRQVFPGADGRIFTPEIERQPATPTTTGTPSTTAITDLLGRMEAVERQLARITSQGEENANKIAQIERRIATLDAGSAAAGEAEVPAASANLSAMSGGASQPTPRATPTPTPRPIAGAPAPRSSPPAAAPSPARLAAVRAIVKPKTDDPGDDEYSYGFRLWEAKFYPEAQQQLRLFIDKYPRHARISYARNLLGRALLDEGKPREAATWFLDNYNKDKTGARAPDSLILLADSMARLNDTNRACIALNGFREDYPLEAAGRLKGQYDAVRAKVKCN